MCKPDCEVNHRDVHKEVQKQIPGRNQLRKCRWSRLYCNHPGVFGLRDATNNKPAKRVKKALTKSKCRKSQVDVDVQKSLAESEVARGKGTQIAAKVEREQACERGLDPKP